MLADLVGIYKAFSEYKVGISQTVQDDGPPSKKIRSEIKPVFVGFASILDAEVSIFLDPKYCISPNPGLGRSTRADNQDLARDHSAKQANDFSSSPVYIMYRSKFR